MTGDAAVDTTVSLVPRTARGLCPTCGTRFTAIGPEARPALQAALAQHDHECADLRAAAALLPKPVDDPVALNDLRAALRVIWKRAS
ncbi:hypothetical protein [Propionicimonas paludicola]|uniref:hypothetical protein n=1 Tax=Propionicimonas paludicola TaxID=185243 RepID=UPI00117B0AD5|nr:hypothetical protein [Propionicimonas paludicola]